MILSCKFIQIMTEQQTQLDKPSITSEPQAVRATSIDQVELLEVYVEKSRALGLGQRLLWHIDKFNRNLQLPNIYDAKDYYLQPLSVKSKGKKQPLKKDERETLLYTELSNTVFYYNDYKVVLLLDFSQSTSSVFPDQSKSYFDKMRDSLQVIIKNLLFQIQNKFKSSPDSIRENIVGLKSIKKTQAEKIQFSFAARYSDDSREESDFKHKDEPFSAIEEQSESGANTTLRADQHETSPVAQRQGNNNSTFNKEKSKNHEPKQFYQPKIYLSIIVSGLPPGNNVKPIVVNQKVEQGNLTELIKSLDQRLIYIEHMLRQNTQQIKPDLADDGIKGSLQTHLQNAQYILDLMHYDAKPLLVFFTDSTSSLLELQMANERNGGKREVFSSHFGKLDASIHKLHLSDARVISVNLQSEIQSCNTLGYINHENELEYLTQITQGVHFTYNQLMLIDKANGDADQSLLMSKRHTNVDELSLLTSATLFERDGLVSFSGDTTLTVFERPRTNSFPSAAHVTRTSTGPRRVSFKGSDKVPLINSLQKVMFARACNFRLFLLSEEIGGLLKPPALYTVLPDHTISCDLRLSDLLFNNKFVPLLQTENLAEYTLNQVSFASLCEFRSKMGFKYLSISYAEDQKVQLTSRKAINTIEYEYCVGMHIYIKCILTTAPKSTVQVKYLLKAPSSTLRLVFKKESDLHERLDTFIKSIFKKDRNFILLEAILQVLQKVPVLFDSTTDPSKYKDSNRMRSKQIVRNIKIQEDSSMADSQVPDIPRNQSHQQSLLKISQQLPDSPGLRRLSTVAEAAKKKSKKGKKEQNAILNELEARKYLLLHKNLFDKLNETIGQHLKRHQWKCYFRYQMFTIITQSAFVATSRQRGKSASDPQFWTRTLNDEWQLESQIERTLVEDIRSFTTFQIDDQTFIQVFENQKNNLIEEKQKYIFNSDQAGIQNKEYDFGFSLIRLVWVATNVAECHFGFYFVGPKQRLSFQQAFQKFISQNRQRSKETESQADSKQVLNNTGPLFTCYKKHITSILMATPKRFQYSLNYLQKQQGQKVESFVAPCEVADLNKQKPLDQLLYNQNQSELELRKIRQQFLKCGQQSDRTQLFYKKEWKWENENKNTNQEFFYKILEQRLNDGFIVINRFQATQEFYHLIKILRASKDKQAETKNNFKRSQSNYSKTSIDDKVQEKRENIDIVVQYLIFIETPNAEESYVRSELYMEQEDSNFELDKTKESNTVKVTSIAGSSNNSGGQLSNENQARKVVSGKNFFDALLQYFNQVDSFLHQSIHTFHHIVKNAVLKQTEQGEMLSTKWQQSHDTNCMNDALREQVCYFKNKTAKNKRMRRQRETQIRQMMQHLHQDWKQFLKSQYPELYQQNSNQTQYSCDFKQLVENSKEFKRFSLIVPQYEPNTDHQLQKDLCLRFQQKLTETLDEFSDFKILGNAIDNETCHYYFKLVTKRILLIIQIPSLALFGSILETTGKLEVVYSKFDQKMVKIPEKIKSNPVCKYLNTQQITEAKVSTNRQAAFLQKINKLKQVKSYNYFGNESNFFMHRDKRGDSGDDQIEKEISPLKRTESMNTKKKKPLQESGLRFSQKESGNINSLDFKSNDDGSGQDDYSDIDEQVNQIDQADELQYYHQYLHKCSYENRRTQLQFETSAREIIKNFSCYLKDCFEKIFAETVIFSLSQTELTGSIQGKDLQKAVSTMGEARFNLDLSFAFVLYQQLLQSSTVKSNQLGLIQEATNQLFFETITRNFTSCPSDPTIFVFKHNLSDEAGNGKDSTFTEAAEKETSRNFRKYNEDLSGTADAYSDNENNTKTTEVDLERPERAQRLSARLNDKREMYSLCKNLLLRVELVIKDKNGREIIRKPTTNFSDLFDYATKEKSRLIPSLVKKAERILNPKDADEVHEEEEVILDGESEASVNDPSAGTSSEKSEASVDLRFTFYTTAQYVGFIRSKDVDFLCQNNGNIIVNDDDCEDLICICKMLGLLQETSSPEVLFKAPLCRQFNKQQILETIPYYFEQIQSNVQQSSNPHTSLGGQSGTRQQLKVFYFEEIQRKIIYGVIRRIYALVAENVSEMLALVRPIQGNTFVQLQKYQGYLIHNQKKVEKIQVFDQDEVKRFKNLSEKLKQQLEESKVVSLNIFKQGEKCLHYLTSNSDAVPFELPEEWHLAEQQILQVSDFSVQFWATFVIQTDESGIIFNFTYHLPQFKQVPEQLSNLIVLSKINEMVIKIRERVKTLFLLQEVNDKKRLSKELRLAEPPQLYLDMFAKESLPELTLSIKSSASLSKSTSVGDSSIKKEKSSSRFHRHLEKVTGKQIQVNTDLPKKSEPETVLQLKNFEHAACIIPTSYLLNAADTVKEIQNDFEDFALIDLPNVYVLKNNQGDINILRISNPGQNILMEIQGINPPTFVDVQQQKTKIIDVIAEITKNKIADRLLPDKNLKFKEIITSELQQGSLNQEDIDYIRGSENKVLLMFPIDSRLTDRLALLKLFQQTLRRKFLMQIHVKKTRTQQINTQVSSQQSAKDSFQFNSFAANLNQEVKSKDSFASNSFVASNSFAASQATTLNSEVKSNILKSPIKSTEQNSIRVSDQIMLYNFKSTCEVSHKDITLGSFLGDALAIVQPTILTQFDAQEFSDRLKTMTSLQLIEMLQKNAQEEFQISGDCVEYQLSELCQSIKSETFNYSYLNSTAETEDFPRLYSIPLIFDTAINSEQQNTFRENDILNLGLDRRASIKVGDASYWMQVTISICGKLQKDLFIKHLTLNLNQAIYDTLIEQHLNKAYILYRPIPKEIPCTNNFFKLRQLLLASQSTHNAASKNYEWHIFGDVQEVNTSLIFALVKKAHEFYLGFVKEHINKITLCAKDSNKLIAQLLSFTLFIQLTDRTTLVCVKKLCIKIPMSKDMDIKTVYKLIQKETRRQDTSLKNIAVSFTLFVGSFPVRTDCLVEDLVSETFKTNCELRNSTIFFVKSSDPECEKGEPLQDQLINSLIGLKSYSNETSNIELESGLKARLTYHKNFFMVMDLKEMKLQINSYNHKKLKLKQFKQMIDNHIAWHTNRQDYLQKNLAQRMGLAYSLLDFQETTEGYLNKEDELMSEKKGQKKGQLLKPSDRIIKTASNLEQLFFERDIYWSKPAQIKTQPIPFQNTLEQLSQVAVEQTYEVTVRLTAKGKKKKKRSVVRKQIKDSVVAKDFNPMLFFAGYFEKLFKIEHRIKKLNLVEEFIRDELKQPSRMSIQPTIRNTKQQIARTATIQQQTNVVASFGITYRPQAEEKRSRRDEFLEFILNKSPTANFNLPGASLLDIYMMSPIFILDMKSEIMMLHIKNASRLTNYPKLLAYNTLNAVALQSQIQIQELLSRITFSQHLSYIAWVAQQNMQKEPQVERANEPWSKVIKSMVKSMAYLLKKKISKDFKQDFLLQVIDKSRLVYNGQTFGLFNQESSQQSGSIGYLIDSIKDQQKSKSERILHESPQAPNNVKQIQDYFEKFCNEMKQKLGITDFVTEQMKLPENFGSLQTFETSFQVSETNLVQLGESGQAKLSESKFQKPQSKCAILFDSQNRLFIYILHIINGCFEIQVYLYEDIQWSIPRQVKALIQVQKAPANLLNEYKLTSGFKTASFYYDFHVMMIYTQITNKNVTLNLRVMLEHLLRKYRQIPKYASNQVQEVIISFEISPQLEAQKFVDYFFQNCKKYGLMATQMTPDGSMYSAACFQNKANEEYYPTAVKAGMADLKNYFRLFVIEQFQQKASVDTTQLKTLSSKTGNANSVDPQKFVELRLHIIYVKEKVQNEKAGNVTLKTAGMHIEMLAKQMRIDKFNFPEFIRERFKECQEDYARKMNWKLFFDFIDSGLPDSIISGLLKLSWKYDINHVPKMRQLLAQRKYSEDLTFSELEKVFKLRTYKFQERNIGNWNPRHDMLIYCSKKDPAKQKFMLHLEVDEYKKSLQIYLLRNMRPELEVEKIQLTKEEKVLVWEVAAVLSNLLWRFASN